MAVIIYYWNQFWEISSNTRLSQSHEIWCCL